jgi:hypothetical protein
MPVILLNDHVLLPHRPNWATDVQWSRAWETKIAPAVTGAESRRAVRAHPRHSLKYSVSVMDLQEQAQLDDRLRAALKSGRVCTPFWGRGQPPTAAFQTEAIVPNLWPWAVGDYVFTMNVHREWEVQPIDEINDLGGGQLELLFAPGFDVEHPVRQLVWPVLYGELAAPDLSALTSWHGELAIEVRELAAPASADVVGDYTPPDPDLDLAIPDQEIGVSNDVR